MSEPETNVASTKVNASYAIAVFCGSNQGIDSCYAEAAIATGQEMVRRHMSLIYGGGAIGLMGILADAILEAGGQVVGVIPAFLDQKEVAHQRVTRLEVVDSMHIRKARMADLADAFLILPGGFGTFDEMCEIVTWAQLGLHNKPIGLLNVNSFFDDWLRQVERAIADGFCRPEHRELFIVENQIEALLERLPAHRPPDVAKWLQRGQT